MVVLLVRPPKPPRFAKAELDQLQEKHLANIRRVAEEGKIFKAEPVEDYSGRNVRGMFILKTNSLAEGRASIATDPPIKAGRLEAEYLKWYVKKRQSEIAAPPTFSLPLMISLGDELA